MYQSFLDLPHLCMFRWHYSNIIYRGIWGIFGKLYLLMNFSRKYHNCATGSLLTHQMGNTESIHFHDKDAIQIQMLIQSTSLIPEENYVNNLPFHNHTGS